MHGAGAEASEVTRQAFAAALTELLAITGKSQTDIARALHVTPSAVSNWVNARNLPDPEALFSLEHELGVTPGALSHHLGYAPVGAVPGVLAAIEADPSLADNAKRALRMAYLSLSGQSSESDMA